MQYCLYRLQECTSTTHGFLSQALWQSIDTGISSDARIDQNLDKDMHYLNVLKTLFCPLETQSPLNFSHTQFHVFLCKYCDLLCTRHLNRIVLLSPVRLKHKHCLHCCSCVSPQVSCVFLLLWRLTLAQ